jgi:flagellar biosynthetic protein FliR
VNGTLLIGGEGGLTLPVMAWLWPFLRVAGLMMVAPVFGARMVPARVRIVLALAVTALIFPLLPAPPAVDPFSAEAVVLAAREILIGVAMGFVVQLIFDAMVIGGQTIAMSMGLGFAMLVDPQRGVSVPVLSQYFLILAILLFLSLDGHLALIGLVVESFEHLPVATSGFGTERLWDIALWGGFMFAGALRIALPAVIALLAVNLAFGVMSRAAPTLNLFAVGFPVALLLGFVILLLSASSVDHVFELLLSEAVAMAARLAGVT